MFATAPPTATSTPNSTPSSTPTEGEKSADEIVDDALTATGSTPSVHVSGTSTDDRGSSSFELDKTPDAARQVTTEASGTETIIVTGGKAYGAVGRGAFSELPADTSLQLRSLTLRGTVDCLRREHGTRTRGSTSTIGDRRVIAIQDDGRAAGAVPATFYVALDGSPLLVRLSVTGRVTPGGARECGHPLDATVQSATFDFDYTRQVAPITAPPVG